MMTFECHYIYICLTYTKANNIILIGVDNLSACTICCGHRDGFGTLVFGLSALEYGTVVNGMVL
jgi:hypothetical protein